MGCFDYTCALTRLPIHSGDPVVYVEYRNICHTGNRDKGCSTYRFLQYTHEATQPFQHTLSEIRSRVERLSLRYKEVDVEKEIADTLQEHMNNARNRIVIVHGEYNDYGGIDIGEVTYPDREIRIDDYNVYFFVHQEAWDAYTGKDDYETLFNLTTDAFNARVELFSTFDPLGQQYSGQEFLDARHKIRHIEEQILPKLAVVTMYNDMAQEE